MMNQLRRVSIGKVRTLVIIYYVAARRYVNKKTVAFPVGSVFEAYTDKHCDWGYLLKFPKRKNLVGFYDKKWFEKVKEVEAR